MNKSRIEWCDYTWNPVTGCLHGCPYCYARKQAENPFYQRTFPFKFEPHFYPERLKDPAKMKKPQTIFVCSMADLFGEWVPPRWIWDIFAAMEAAPWHTYIMLTKNPGKMKRFAPEKGDQPRGVKENWWFGSSVTSKDDVTRIKPLREMDGNRFISFEPLLGDPGTLDLTGIRQVILGAQTNPRRTPSSEAIRRVVLAAADTQINRFFKDSMNGVSWIGWSTFINNHDLCWQVHK